jgi:uncharacterized membrane protein
MPFCSNCGAAVEGRFCAQCGTPVGGGSAQPAGVSPTVTPLPGASSGLADNTAGALCYALLLITGVLFLLLEPYNKNRAIRFHAMQAILLNVAWFVIWFACSIVLGFAHVGVFLLPLIWIGFVVLWIYMIVTTYQGKTVVLPVIGQLAQQQA